MIVTANWFYSGTLLALRILIGILFATSGWAHVAHTEERARSIGMPPTFTWALGAIELLAAVSVAVGLFPVIGAIALAAVMVGATTKKVLVWKTGFWGKSNDGWFYEVLYLVCNLVIFATGGGGYIIFGK